MVLGIRLRRPGWLLLAAAPASIVAAAIAAGVLIGSAIPQSISSVVAALLAVLLYVRAARQDPERQGGPLSRLLLVNIGLILLFAVVNYLYGLSNRPIGETHSVRIGVDGEIPVVPAFVIPYLGLYPFVAFTIAALAVLVRHAELRTLLLGLIGSTVVGLITFVTFQTFVAPPRPSEYGPEPFRSMIAYVEDTLFDGQFYSGFPSLHVAYSVLLALAWFRLRRAILTPILIAFSVSIVLATQFLHQHYVLDLVYGVGLAAAMYAAAWWYTEARIRSGPLPQDI